MCLCIESVGWWWRYDKHIIHRFQSSSSSSSIRISSRLVVRTVFSIRRRSDKKVTKKSLRYIENLFANDEVSFETEIKVKKLKKSSVKKGKFNLTFCKMEYKCPSCAYLSDSITLLHVHCINAHPKEFFTCPWCTVPFATLRILQKHAPNCSALDKNEPREGEINTVLVNNDKCLVCEVRHNFI